ncbi:MAG: DUF2231 domain-containing protein [Gammaproteobacteria bacterium]
MSGLLGWHPMVVHFPLALVLTASVLLWAAGLWSRTRHAATLSIVGTWNLCLGTVAALFALATGLAAVLHLQTTAAAHLAISLHLKWAIFSTLILVLLSVWRGAGTAQDSRPSWIFLVVLLAAAASLAMTGYRGGQNVYRYGVGVHMVDGR